MIGYRWADNVYLPRSRQLPASLTADLPHMGESSSASGDGGRVSKGFGQLVVNRMEGGGGEECSFLRRMAEGEKLWEELGRSFNVSPVPLGWE